MPITDRTERGARGSASISVLSCDRVTWGARGSLASGFRWRARPTLGPRARLLAAPRSSPDFLSPSLSGILSRISGICAVPHPHPVSALLSGGALVWLVSTSASSSPSLSYSCIIHHSMSCSWSSSFSPPMCRSTSSPSTSHVWSIYLFRVSLSFHSLFHTSMCFIFPSTHPSSVSTHIHIPSCNFSVSAFLCARVRVFSCLHWHCVAGPQVTIECLEHRFSCLLQPIASVVAGASQPIYRHFARSLAAGNRRKCFLRVRAGAFFFGNRIASLIFVLPSPLAFACALCAAFCFIHFSWRRCPSIFPHF